MISLFLTLFISVFSFCPSINRLEDHNENTVTINDEPPVKNLGYYDEYGVQLYLFNADLLGNEFITYFIAGIAGNEGTNNNHMSFTNDVLVSMSFTTQGAFYYCEGGYVDTSRVLTNIDMITLSKSYSQLRDIEGNPYYVSQYQLYFLYNNVSKFQINYWILSPVYDDMAHELGGVTVLRSYYQYNGLNTEFFAYFENSLNNYYPVISYFYDNWLDHRITINNERFNSGYDLGHSSGYQEGYNQALEDTQAYDTTASTIFNGALEIGLLPVNFFLSIFNFEVFGLNIKSIVSALLTLAVVIIIVRFLFGGKDDK